MKNTKKDQLLESFERFRTETSRISGGESGAVGARQDGGKSYLDIQYVNGGDVACDVLISTHDAAGWIDTVVYDSIK